MNIDIKVAISEIKQPDSYWYGLIYNSIQLLWDNSIGDTMRDELMEITGLTEIDIKKKFVAMTAGVLGAETEIGTYMGGSKNESTYRNFKWDSSTGRVKDTKYTLANAASSTASGCLQILNGTFSELASTFSTVADLGDHEDYTYDSDSLPYKDQYKDTSCVNLAQAYLYRTCYNAIINSFSSRSIAIDFLTALYQGDKSNFFLHLIYLLYGGYHDGPGYIDNFLSSFRYSTIPQKINKMQRDVIFNKISTAAKSVYPKIKQAYCAVDPTITYTPPEYTKPDINKKIVYSSSDSNNDGNLANIDEYLNKKDSNLYSSDDFDDEYHQTRFFEIPNEDAFIVGDVVLSSPQAIMKQPSMGVSINPSIRTYNDMVAYTGKRMDPLQVNFRFVGDYQTNEELRNLISMVKYTPIVSVANKEVFSLYGLMQNKDYVPNAMDYKTQALFAMTSLNVSSVFESPGDFEARVVFEPFLKSKWGTFKFFKTVASSIQYEQHFEQIKNLHESMLYDNTPQLEQQLKLLERNLAELDKNTTKFTYESVPFANMYRTFLEGEEQFKFKEIPYSIENRMHKYYNSNEVVVKDGIKAPWISLEFPVLDFLSNNISINLTSISKAIIDSYQGNAKEYGDIIDNIKTIGSQFLDDQNPYSSKNLFDDKGLLGQATRILVDTPLFRIGNNVTVINDFINDIENTYVKDGTEPSIEVAAMVETIRQLIIDVRKESAKEFDNNEISQVNLGPNQQKSYTNFNFNIKYLQSQGNLPYVLKIIPSDMISVSDFVKLVVAKHRYNEDGSEFLNVEEYMNYIAEALIKLYKWSNKGITTGISDNIKLKQKEIVIGSDGANTTISNVSFTVSPKLSRLPMTTGDVFYQHLGVSNVVGEVSIITQDLFLISLITNMVGGFAMLNKLATGPEGRLMNLASRIKINDSNNLFKMFAVNECKLSDVSIQSISNEGGSPGLFEIKINFIQDDLNLQKYSTPMSGSYVEKTAFQIVYLGIKAKGEVMKRLEENRYLNKLLNENKIDSLNEYNVTTVGNFTTSLDVNDGLVTYKDEYGEEFKISFSDSGDEWKNLFESYTQKYVEGIKGSLNNANVLESNALSNVKYLSLLSSIPNPLTTKTGRPLAIKVTDLMFAGLAANQVTPEIMLGLLEKELFGITQSYLSNPEIRNKLVVNGRAGEYIDDLFKSNKYYESIANARSYYDMVLPMVNKYKTRSPMFYMANIPYLDTDFYSRAIKEINYRKTLLYQSAKLMGFTTKSKYDLLSEDIKSFIDKNYEKDIPAMSAMSGEYIKYRDSFNKITEDIINSRGGAAINSRTGSLLSTINYEGDPNTTPQSLLAIFRLTNAIEMASLVETMKQAVINSNGSGGYSTDAQIMVEYLSKASEAAGGEGFKSVEELANMNYDEVLKGVCVLTDTEEGDKYLTDPAISTLISRISDLGKGINLIDSINGSNSDTVIKTLSAMWGIWDFDSQARYEDLMKKALQSATINSDCYSKIFPTFKIIFSEKDNNRIFSYDDIFSYYAVNKIQINKGRNTQPVAMLEITDHLGMIGLQNELVDNEAIYESDSGVDLNITRIYLRPGTRTLIYLGYGADEDLELVFQGTIVNMNRTVNRDTYTPVINIEAHGHGWELNQVLAPEGVSLGKSGAIFGEFLVGDGGGYYVSNLGDVATWSLKQVEGLDYLGKSPYVDFTQDRDYLREKEYTSFIDKFGTYITQTVLKKVINDKAFSMFNKNTFGVDDNIYLKYSVGSESRNKGTGDNSFDWTIQNKTCWDVLDELSTWEGNFIVAMRDFNTQMANGIFGCRSTVYVGPKDGYYKSNSIYKSDTKSFTQNLVESWKYFYSEIYKAATTTDLRAKLEYIISAYNNIETNTLYLGNDFVPLLESVKNGGVRHIKPILDGLVSDENKVSSKFVYENTSLKRIYPSMEYVEPTDEDKNYLSKTVAGLGEGLGEGIGSSIMAARWYDKLANSIIPVVGPILLNYGFKLFDSTPEKKDISNYDFLVLCLDFLNIANFDNNTIYLNDTVLESIFTHQRKSLEICDEIIKNIRELADSKLSSWEANRENDEFFLNNVLGPSKVNKLLGAKSREYSVVQNLHTITHNDILFCDIQSGMNEEYANEVTFQFGEEPFIWAPGYKERGVNLIKKIRNADDAAKEKDFSGYFKAFKNPTFSRHFVACLDDDIPPELKVQYMEQSTNIQLSRIRELDRTMKSLKEVIGSSQASTNTEDRASVIYDRLPQYMKTAINILGRKVSYFYSGNITIIGNPRINDHDLVYIQDEVNDIKGIIEVDQVTHIFDINGYTTTIKPAMLTYMGDYASMYDMKILRSIENYSTFKKLYNGGVVIGAGIGASIGGFIGGTAGGIAGTAAAPGPGTAAGAGSGGIGFGTTGAIIGGLIGAPISMVLGRGSRAEATMDRVGRIFGRQAIDIMPIWVGEKPLVHGLEGYQKDTIEYHMRTNDGNGDIIEAVYNAWGADAWVADNPAISTYLGMYLNLWT